MTRSEIFEQIRKKRSYLCVGLDTELSLLPAHLQKEKDAVFQFNKAIIDVTKDLCIGYKINTAFYESAGLAGWESMEKTVRYIGDDHFKIADAKRGDIGNTSAQYAKAFFETLPFDAITVAPYMGKDSISPFLAYTNKWTIVLGLTSNAGASDFELQEMDNGLLYEKVLRTVSQWGNPDNLMFVVGATRPEEFINIRKICPEHFFLVPGVGAQGGDLKEISAKTIQPNAGIIVNASRAIIYASHGEDYAQAARAVAEQYREEMQGYIF